jgi:NAD(P)-dependent dehydrogenase (short-subunit alcohol dehydrogenase family)
MYTIDLSRKRILITGGCGAIGRVMTRVLADAGAVVIVNDILPDDEAKDVLIGALAWGAGTAYFREDVTSDEGVEHLFGKLEETLGLPDIVCCHAGMAAGTYPIEQYPMDRFDALMSLNLRAAFMVAQAATKRWIARGIHGHLIFTTSWVQDVPWPQITPYNASKAALKAVMRGCARELAPHGIRANAVAPGIVSVGMAKRQWDTDPSYRARAEKAIPLGFLQPPESVANAFLFLCSDLADYMTGSVLLVDGGCSLYPMD